MEVSTTYKKLSVLYILEILKKYSDEENPMTQADIIKKLKGYGLVLERKSIKRNIENLIEAGYDIALPDEGGCYLRVRRFEEAELRFLVDSVINCKVMPVKQKKDLIDRLLEDSNIKFKKELTLGNIQSLYFENIAFTNIISLINEATNKQNYIEVTYKNANDNQRQKLGLIPYKLINAYGNYYLIYILESYLRENTYVYNIAEYIKIDDITNIRIIDKGFKSFKLENLNFDNFDLSKFGTENPNKLPLKTERMKIVISDSIIDKVYMAFGKDIVIKKDTSNISKDMDNIIDLKANRYAVKYWLLQYKGAVIVIEPEDFKHEFEYFLYEYSSSYDDYKARKMDKENERKGL